MTQKINPKQYENGSYYKAVERAPAAFLPYQKKWVEDKSSVKIIEKSRRIGLSWCEAADNVLTAAANNGMDIFYVSYNKDMTVTYINDCAQWARHFSLAASDIEVTEEVFRENDEDKSILVYSIKFASGFRIEALSSMPRNLRSKQGGVVVDEAAFHTDLDELLTAAFALIMWGGFVHILSTHKGVDNPFNELISMVRAGDKDYSLHKTTFNQAIADGLYRRVCLRMKKDWTPQGELAWEKQIRSIYTPRDAEELDCIPAQSTGAYFSRALIESRMSGELPVLRLECPDEFELKPENERVSFIGEWLQDNIKPLLDNIPKGYRFYYGQDFARSLHLSVIWALVEESSLKKYTPFVLEMRNVPFEQQKQILFYICDNVPCFMGGANDARGNGQYLSEVAAQRYGATRILRIMTSLEWYRDNMPKYKAAYEDGEITIPKDSGILDDHRAVQLINGVPKVPDINSGTSKKARHGDTAIAGCLAWHASLNCEGAFEFMSDGQRDHYDEYQGFIHHG